MLFRLFRRGWVQRSSSAPVACRRAVRLGIEVLEIRALPQATTLEWTAPPSVKPATLVNAAPSASGLELSKPLIVSPASSPTNNGILAKGNTWLAHSAGPQQAIIQSSAQLLADTGLSVKQLASILNVPTINWQLDAVVFVSEGTGIVDARTPSVNIAGIGMKNGEPTVSWNLQELNPNSIAPGYAIKADPAGFALVHRITGPVQFVRGATVILPPPPPLVLTDPTPLPPLVTTDPIWLLE